MYVSIGVHVIPQTSCKITQTYLTMEEIEKLLNTSIDDDDDDDVDDDDDDDDCEQHT